MLRATEYTEELAVQICTRIAEGEALARICRDESMPNVSSVYRWVATNEKFRTMYQLAREDQADTLGDQILEISDEAPIIVKRDDEGNEVEVVLDAAAVQRQRLRVDARKFVAAKLKPKKWGDRTELVGAGGAPLIPFDPMSEWSDSQRALEGARRLAFILARANLLLDSGVTLPERGEAALLTNQSGADS